MSNNQSKTNKPKRESIIRKYAEHQAKQEKAIQKEKDKMKKAIEERTSKIDTIIKESEKPLELCDDKLSRTIQNHIKQEIVDVKIPWKFKIKTAIGLMKILKKNIKKLKGERHIYSYQTGDINTDELMEKEKTILTQMFSQLETSPKGQWNLFEETKETIIKRFTNDFTHDCRNYLNNVMGKTIIFDDPIEINMDRQKETMKSKLPECTTPRKLVSMFKNDKQFSPRKWDDGTITLFSIEGSLKEELDNIRENWDEEPVVEVNVQELEQCFTSETLTPEHSQIKKNPDHCVGKSVKKITRK
jgi:hypothetical protein